MDDAIRAPTRGAIYKLTRVLQWIVFALLALFALVVIAEIRKASVPGAPVVLLYLSVTAMVLLAVTHLPLLFSRLPRRGRWAAYGAILPVFILWGTYLGQMEPAWRRTPEGAKEAAERADADRRVVAEQSRENARLQAESEAAAQTEAADKQASVDAQKPEMCRTLIDQVVDGEKVLEINNVSVQTSYNPEVLTCSGNAITARGDVKIEFGLVKTPQGKTLVSVRYP